MSRLEAPSSPTGLSPTRSGKRHQIKRSLSELASPTRGSRTQSRREPPQDDRHLHLVHSTPITRRSLDTPRFDGSNMAQSPEDSRRPSMLVARDDAAERAASREARQKSLRIEEARVIESSENLTQTLVELNGFSANASQRLDEAYYAVLEKMTTLQGTITLLKDLAGTSQEICDHFDKESRSLENDVVTQLGSLGHFQGRQNQISALQERVDSGRKNMVTLEARLQKVQKRIEKWEQADRQWQEKTRKRLKIIWSAMSAVIIVLLILVWGIHHATDSSNVNPGSDNTQSTDNLISILEPLNKSNYAQAPGMPDSAADTKLRWQTTQPNDDGLRALDEL